MVQISPWLTLPERVFSVSSSTADSGYHSSITEEETREVCQKRLGRKSGSLGNFYNVSAHIYCYFLFLLYFIFYLCAGKNRKEWYRRYVSVVFLSEVPSRKRFIILSRRKRAFRAGLSGERLRTCLVHVYLFEAIYRSRPVGIRLDVIRLTSHSICVSRQHLNIR